jgi:hypothetical protein
MSRPGGGHRSDVQRYMWPIVVVGGILLILAVLLLIGVIRGDDTDLERRQEEPRSGPAAYLS